MKKLFIVALFAALVTQITPVHAAKLNPAVAAASAAAQQPKQTGLSKKAKIAATLATIAGAIAAGVYTGHIDPTAISGLINASGLVEGAACNAWEIVNGTTQACGTNGTVVNGICSAVNGTICLAETVVNGTVSAAVNGTVNIVDGAIQCIPGIVAEAGFWETLKVAGGFTGFGF